MIEKRNNKNGEIWDDEFHPFQRKKIIHESTDVIVIDIEDAEMKDGKIPSDFTKYYDVKSFEEIIRKYYFVLSYLKINRKYDGQIYLKNKNKIFRGRVTICPSYNMEYFSFSVRSKGEI